MRKLPLFVLVLGSLPTFAASQTPPSKESPAAQTIREKTAGMKHLDGLIPLHWDAKTGQGRPFYYFSYGAACSEVVIDTFTGEMKVTRADILHDVGRSINPAIDLGQIEGGFVQGMGWLTSEELVYDAEGRLLTHAPSTYKIPTSADVPKDFRVALWPGENRADTIYRSKAVGEPPLMLAISVFAAVADAIHSLAPGKLVPLDAPATPEAILRAVNAVRQD